MAEDPTVVGLLDRGTQTLRVGVEDDIAVRARGWYLEAINHPLWVTFSREADEDEGYYVGGEGQWSKDGSLQDRESLIARNRTAVSINHIQAIVDLVVGLEQGNRFDIKAAPQGDSPDDAQDAELMTILLKWVQDRADVHEYISDAFEDAVIRGASCLLIEIDYTEDQAHGEVHVTQAQVGKNKEVIWDPHWTRYDLSDARYILRQRWTWVEDVVAQFSQHEDLIRDALGGALRGGPGVAKTTDGGDDAYGSVTDHPTESSQFYDREGGRVLVLEVWYRVYEDLSYVMDRLTGALQEAPSAPAAAAAVAADPERLKTVRHVRPRIRMATVLPEILATLEDDWSPYENDPSAYPIVPLVIKRKGTHLFGMVRNLKDPQRLENKRRSQLHDIVAKFANARRMYVAGSIEPQHLADPTDTAPIPVKRGEKFAEWDIPNLGPLAQILTVVGQGERDNLREISGINQPMLGERSRAESGIAIARLQAQGQIIATPFFTKLARTRKLIGQRLAARVQQVFTFEHVIRLTVSEQPVVLRLNPLEAKHLSAEDFLKFRETLETQGRERVLRDVSALKYDVVISAAPTSPSARAAALLMWLELVEKIPGLLPLVIDKIIELSDVPDRAEVLDRLRQQPQWGGPPPAPGPAGPAGAPAGAAAAAALPTGATAAAPPPPMPMGRPA